MKTRQILVSAVVVIILGACGTGAPDGSSSSLAQSASNPPGMAATAARAHGGVTLDVPAQYGTIAGALAAAQSGDTVRVAAGTYKECIVLKDGVTLAGPEVPSGTMPLAVIDGDFACSPVISGDASITHGATVKGFRVINSYRRGIELIGSQGVRLSALSVSNPNAMPLLADHASFTLEHSMFRDCGGAACVDLHEGAKGVLVENDIAGGLRGVLLHGRLPLNDPNSAPARAQLVRNRIHQNSNYGVLVQDKGSEIQGIGNVYDANTWGGVQVVGGASYRGEGDAMTNSPGAGITLQGCALRCFDTPCSENMRVVVGPSSAVLHKVTISGNQWTGIWAPCGGDVAISQSVVVNNTWGVVAAATMFLDPDNKVSVPSTFSARDTQFVGNSVSGIQLAEKGVAGQGFRNRFSGGDIGVHVWGGAAYTGRDDTMSSNRSFGVFATGCGTICSDFNCNLQDVVQEQSDVGLGGATVVDNSSWGLISGCGAVLDVRTSLVARNAGGALAVADILGGLAPEVPATIRAHGTVFADNLDWGVIGYDSHLDLGSLEEPGLNSFLRNWAAIANVYNAYSIPAFAQWNWFGTANPEAIARIIGTDVSYLPFLTRPPRGGSIH